MKAHLALFEGEGEPKNEALLFQSTVDILFSKRAQNTKKLRRLALCAFISHLVNCDIEKFDCSS